MTNEQKALLNRRISEERGWRVEQYQDYDGERYYDAWRLVHTESGLKMNGHPSEEIAWMYAEKWTNDDHANCILLDEIINELGVERGMNKILISWLVGEPWTYRRRIAVALAYARLRGLSLEGIC